MRLAVKTIHLVSFCVGNVDFALAAQHQVVQIVCSGSRRGVTFQQLALRIEVHNLRAILLARVCRTPHAMIRRIKVHSADWHQVVQPFLHEIRELAGFRDPHDLVVVHAAHEEDAFRCVHSQTFREEVLLRHGERHLRTVHWGKTPTHLLNQLAKFRIVLQRCKCPRLRRIKTFAQRHALFQQR